MKLLAIIVISQVVSCGNFARKSVNGIDEVSDTSKNPIVGKWNNLYQDSQELAGVAIYKEMPDGGSCGIAKDKAKMHPAGVTYFFWNGTYIEYWYHQDGDGNVKLLEIKHYHSGSATKSDWSWVNFSYGSDPFFKIHQDPRSDKNKSSIKPFDVKIIKQDVCNGKTVEGQLTVYNSKSIFD